MPLAGSARLVQFFPLDGSASSLLLCARCRDAASLAVGTDIKKDFGAVLRQ
jgi:hypothetical protein